MAELSASGRCSRCGLRGIHACVGGGVNTSATHGTRRCPTCNGRGVNPVLPTYVCPKCHGEKVVANG